MLDGGIVDSIPVKYAFEQGYEDIVVVLTRNKGYRKKEGKMRAAKAFYRKYPDLQKALYERNAVYNQTMDMIERLEEQGKIVEKDTAKLAALYDKIMPNTKDKTGAYNFSPEELPQGTDSRITAAYTPSNNIGYIITAKAQETELAIGINAFGKAYCVFDLDGNELTNEEAYAEIKAVAESALEPVYKKSEKRNLRSLGSLFSDSAVFEAVIPDTDNSTVSATYKVTDGADEKYAIIAQPIGFGGVIKLCVVMTKDGQISNFKILSHTESAYYGDKIATEQYSNNIKDKKLDSLSDSDFQVSSATITSEAVKVAIKDIKEAFAKIKEGF
jgi:Na+-translocating ferredoxin:NAD+ oxidoreductase RnfG subunit